MTTEEMQRKIESSMLSNEEVFKKIDNSLKKRQRRLIFTGIGLILRFIIETAIIIAVIWLVIKQYST